MFFNALLRPLTNPGASSIAERLRASLALIGAGLAAALLVVIIGAVTPDGGLEAGAEPPTLRPNVAPDRVEAPTTRRLSNADAAPLEVRVVRSYPFIWPAEGPITSEMGPWHPVGLDVGLEYGGDSPIWAAAGGEVVFAGGGEWHEYGNHIVIEHGGGMKTLYGHLETIYVGEGDVVRQGDLIGLGGSTGKADGKHLHFEVHAGKSQIDPLHVLPPHGEPAPGPLTIDCGREAIVMESGAPLALTYVDGSGPRSISDVRAEAVAVSPDALPVSASVEANAVVRFETLPTVTGTGADDEYRLVAQADGAELSCTVFVQTRTVAPSFYVRPTSTPTPIPPTATPAPATATFTPTPTYTPTPTPTKTPFPLPRNSN